MKKLILAILFLGACSFTQLRMQKYVGQNQSAVLEGEGPPTQVISNTLNDGGYIWVYSSQSQQVFGGQPLSPISGQGIGVGFANGFAQGMNSPRVTNKVRHVMFWFKEDGTVEKVTVAKQ